jgi:hypothetical protein
MDCKNPEDELPRELGLCKEHGVWVLRTGEPMSSSVTDKMLAQIREERDHAHLAGDECRLSGSGFVQVVTAFSPAAAALAYRG